MGAVFNRVVGLELAFDTLEQMGGPTHSSHARPRGPALLMSGLRPPILSFRDRHAPREGRLSILSSPDPEHSLVARNHYGTRNVS